MMHPDEIYEIWEEKGVIDTLKEFYRDDAERLISHVEAEEAYLGSVFSLWPSGKFWTAWACSNVAPKEMIRDSLFTEALEEIAEKYGGFIEFGEGDPTDVFFVREGE